MKGSPCSGTLTSLRKRKVSRGLWLYPEPVLGVFPATVYKGSFNPELLISVQSSGEFSERIFQPHHLLICGQGWHWLGISCDGSWLCLFSGFCSSLVTEEPVSLLSNRYQCQGKRVPWWLLPSRIDNSSVPGTPSFMGQAPELPSADTVVGHERVQEPIGTPGSQRSMPQWLATESSLLLLGLTTLRVGNGTVWPLRLVRPGLKS